MSDVRLESGSERSRGAQIVDEPGVEIVEGLRGVTEPAELRREDADGGDGTGARCHAVGRAIHTPADADTKTSSPSPPRG